MSLILKRALAAFFTALLGWASAANAAFIDVDLSGWESWDFYGAAGNTTTVISLPTGTGIIGAQYIDLEFEALGQSWASELVLSINDSASALSFWDSTVAGMPSSPGVFGPVSGAFAVPGLFSSGPFTLTTGALHIEAYETFNDLPGADTLIRAGTLRIEIDAVPAPATLALFGIGLLGFGWSLRRRA